MKFAEGKSGGSGKYKSGKCTLDERNGRYKITFLPRNQTDDTAIEKRMFYFDKALLPKYPKDVVVENKKKYLINVVFKTDDDKATKDIEEIKYIRPLNWTDELMKIVDISRENYDPQGTPTFYEYHWKDNPEEYWIDWIFEFVEGEYEGCRVPLKVKYLFTGDGEGKAMFNFSQRAYEYEKSVRIHQFIHFYARQLGIINFKNFDPALELEWPDDGNVAPTLFGRALAKKMYFRTNGDGNRYIEYSDVEVADYVEPTPDPDVEKEDHAPADIHPEDELPEEW